jgi:hypothetical protein
MVSFLTLPRELRHDILGKFLNPIILLDLAYNLEFLYDAERHNIVEREQPRLGKLLPRINQQTKILTAVIPELAEDCAYMLKKARQSLQNQYNQVMDVWIMLKVEKENKLTLLNIGLYVKEEGAPTVGDVPRIKQRFRLHHP